MVGVPIKMIDNEISSLIQQIEIDGRILLFQLDTTRLGGDVYYFHGHTNQGAIVWQGQEYSPISINIDGLERRGDAKASAPTLSVVNQLDGVTGVISALCIRLKDLVGAKVTIIETFKRFLDPVNFPSKQNPEADNKQLTQVWYIKQKTGETYAQIDFELVSPIDFMNAKLPRRQMTRYCEWARRQCYRGDRCGYMGVDMFTKQGEPTDDPAKDRCGGRLSDCKLRHGDTTELPFGGFPAVGLVKM